MQRPPSDSRTTPTPRGLLESCTARPSSTRRAQLIWISEAGEIDDIDWPTAAARLARMCHRSATAADRGLAGTEIEACPDIMELYAFVRPARFCLPTPRGLATQPVLPLPAGGEDMAALLPRAAFALLDELASAPAAAQREAGAIATMMAASGWAGDRSCRRIWTAHAALAPPGQGAGSDLDTLANIPTSHHPCRPAPRRST